VAGKYNTAFLIKCLYNIHFGVDAKAVALAPIDDIHDGISVVDIVNVIIVVRIVYDFSSPQIAFYHPTIDNSNFNIRYLS
jgi:hypothetical protein